MRVRHFLLVLPLASLLAFATGGIALAQGIGKGADDAPVVAPPSEFSEDARRAYAQGLREARDLIAQKRYDEAIARVDALLKERPREPHARFLRAVALSDQGKADLAIVALRDLVADYPELPEPHNNLAVLYAQKGEYEIARSELALAIAARPDYAVAHENLGDVYVRLAASQYERVGKLDATNKTAPAKLKLAREIVASVAPVR
jgi:Flp pilus assembly protein TadD